MSKGSKRRREARRRSREREQAPGEAPSQETRVASTEGEPEPASGVRAAPSQAHSVRKKAKRRPSAWQRLQRARISPWLIATPVAAAGVVILAVLILTSGSSGSSGVPSAEPTPDPRVAGLTPDASVSLNVDDANFSRTELTGKAGEVIEFVVTNTGTISHNMTVAGVDDEYDTEDDFITDPFAIQAGETGRLVLKIDEAATYRFRCAFHPDIEFGTLTLE